jgi:hypothetical protein
LKERRSDLKEDASDLSVEVGGKGHSRVREREIGTNELWY